MNKLLSLKRKINNRLLKYSYKFKLTRLPAWLPNSLDIEISNYCSLDCLRCPRKDMKRPQGNMPLELFKKIINDAYPEVSFCWLHLFGEPLLNKQLPEMIQYAKSHDIRCGISTNGMELTEEAGKRLCEAGLDTIVISLDAAERETYEKIRQGGDFEKVVKNIETFLALPEKKNIREIIIQMIKFDLNKKEVNSFIERWRGPDRKVHIKEEETWAGYYSVKGKENIIKRYPCYKLWKRLTIDWQGNVSICCRDFMIREKVGNIKSQSLKDIWNNKRMVKIRKMMVTNQYDRLSLCKDCREWGYYSIKNYSKY